jgi:hypothetical protein
MPSTIMLGQSEGALQQSPLAQQMFAEQCPLVQSPSAAQVAPSSFLGAGGGPASGLDMPPVPTMIIEVPPWPPALPPVGDKFPPLPGKPESQMPPSPQLLSGFPPVPTPGLVSS